MALTRRGFMAGAAALAAAAKRAGAGQRPARKPNIVLIESDDHAWDALGCMGDLVLKTPHIDRLAQRGVLFRNHICQGAECVPSRHSLLTGCYPHNNGVYSNRCAAIDERQWTLPAALQRTDYHTALIGKNHFRPRGTPGAKDFADPAMIEGWKTYGFDDVRAVNGKVSAALGWREGPYRAYLRGKGLLEKHEQDYKTHRYTGRRAARGYVGASPLREEDCHDAFIARLFADWVAGYKGEKPFFAWVDFVAPHLPCDAPEPYATMYDAAKMRAPLPIELDTLPQAMRARIERRMKGLTPELVARVRAGYYGLISLLDAQVGKMVAALEKHGLLENTVVVFVGDQGNQLGDHGLWGKGTLFKASINSPLVVSCPARFRQGAAIDRPVEMQDLAPTFLELASAKMAELRNCYGRSLLPLLTGKGAYDRQAAFAEKLGTKMAATADHKLIYDPAWDRPMLFDLRKDPNETKNLAGKPEAAAAERDMKDRLLAWLAGTYAHPNSWRPKQGG